MKWWKTVFNSCTSPYISSYGSVTYVMLDNLYSSLYIYRMCTSKFSKAHELSWKMQRKYVFYCWTRSSNEVKTTDGMLTTWEMYEGCSNETCMITWWCAWHTSSCPWAVQANRNIVTLLNASIPGAEPVQIGSISSHSVPSTNRFHLKNPHTHFQ